MRIGGLRETPSTDPLRARPLPISPVRIMTTAGMVAAPVLGTLLGRVPGPALAVIAAVAVWRLLASAAFRLPFVILAGLATLQTSQNLSTVKVLYLVCTAVATLAATRNCILHRESIALRALKPILALDLVVAGLLATSAAVALANGSTPSGWLRDLAPYALFVAAPVLALDNHASDGRLTTDLLVVAGLLSAASFAIECENARLATPLPVKELVLPSGFLPLAMASYAFSSALQARNKRVAWSGAGILAYLLLLLPGVRSALVHLVAIPAILLSTPVRNIRRTAIGFMLAGGAISVGVLGLLLLHQSGVIRNAPTYRFLSLLQVAANPLSDASARSRVLQSGMAWQAFVSHPVAGIGLGHLYQWRDEFGVFHSTTTLDTPLLLLARFGSIGMVVSIAVAAVYVAFAARLRQYQSTTVPRSALIGFITVAIVWLIVGGPPMEDKGFSFGLMLLLTLALGGLAPRAVESSNEGP